MTRFFQTAAPTDRYSGSAASWGGGLTAGVAAAKSSNPGRHGEEEMVTALLPYQKSPSGAPLPREDLTPSACVAPQIFRIRGLELRHALFDPSVSTIRSKPDSWSLEGSRVSRRSWITPIGRTERSGLRSSPTTFRRARLVDRLDSNVVRIESAGEPTDATRRHVAVSRWFGDG